MPKTDWQIEGSEVRVILEDQGQKTKTQLMSFHWRMHVSFQYEVSSKLYLVSRIKRAMHLETDVTNCIHCLPDKKTPTDQLLH